jgi:hypothetical protein
VLSSAGHALHVCRVLGRRRALGYAVPTRLTPDAAPDARSPAPHLPDIADRLVLHTRRKSMASGKTHGRQQWLLALLATGGTVVGALIAGGASYVATREANRAVIQRDERNDQLDARSAARLVESELALVAARLTFLQKEQLDAASLARALRNLPATAWRANQQHLARTLTAHDWGYVSQAYVMTNAFSSNVHAIGVPDVTLRLLLWQVRQARKDLMPYE